MEQISEKWGWMDRRMKGRWTGRCVVRPLEGKEPVAVLTCLRAQMGTGSASHTCKCACLNKRLEASH